MIILFDFSGKQKFQKRSILGLRKTSSVGDLSVTGYGDEASAEPSVLWCETFSSVMHQVVCSWTKWTASTQCSPSLNHLKHFTEQTHSSI